MKKRNRGFTLIELLMTMAVLLVVLASGMSAFYKTLRGGTKADLSLELDSGARQMMNSLSFLLRHAEVESLSGQDKADCLAAGETGLNGTVLDLNMVDGGETTVEVIGDRLASSSAGLGDIYLAAEGLQVEDLNFVWKCQAGQKDEVGVNFTVNRIGEEGEVLMSKDFSLVELLRNSGY